MNVLLDYHSSPQGSRSPARESRPHCGSLSQKAQNSMDTMAAEGSSAHGNDSTGRMDNPSPKIQSGNEVYVHDEKVEKEVEFEWSYLREINK